MKLLLLNDNANRQGKSNMRTHEKLPSANTLCMALAITFFSVMVFPQDAVAEPSAEEILAESGAAMSQPLKYRHILGDTEMVVYQKTLPDGSLAMLMDISSPIKKISIIYGDKSYGLYLDHRVAIDTQFMFQGAKSKAASVVSSLGGKAAKSSKLLGTVQRDGKNCYEIESTLTPDVLAALAKAATPEAKNKIPAKYRYVIDKDTYLMVEKETLSQDGSSLSKVEYRDVKPQPDLSDDFFQVPSGFEIKKPKTMSEYTSIIGDMLSPDTTIKALQKKLEQLKQRPPPLRTPPKQNLLSPADIKKMAEARHKSRMRQVDDRAEEIQPKSTSTVRKIVLVFSSVLFVICLIVFVLHRLKKAK